MTREEYLAQRQELMNQAQTQIDNADLEAAEAAMQQVRELDNKWDDICKAQANARALAGEVRKVDVQTGMTPNGGTLDRTSGEEENVEASDLYKNAWANVMMGRQLTAEQKHAVEMVNEAYTHTTQNTPIVIPETVMKGIWELIGEMYPYWNDITKTYVKGTLTVVKGETSTEAKWYDEATETEDGKETFGSLQLNGCELSRAITVSWKLREMSMEEFIPYIQRKLAEKMGAALGYGVTHGKGVVEGEKPEPLGVVSALEKEEGTPQVVEYEKGKLDYKTITSARSKVKSGYGAGLAIYANSYTIWNELANVVDANKRPMFVPDVMRGGVGNVLGMVVKEDDSMKDGEVLMSNPGVGYTANVNKNISMSTEEHVKAREADYCAYAIVDGGALTTKTHALLKYKAE